MQPYQIITQRTEHKFNLLQGLTTWPFQSTEMSPWIKWKQNTGTAFSSALDVSANTDWASANKIFHRGVQDMPNI